eukprot:5394737-Pyramimonas_sp.AAC.1
MIDIMYNITPPYLLHVLDDGVGEGRVLAVRVVVELIQPRLPRTTRVHMLPKRPPHVLGHEGVQLAQRLPHLPQRGVRLCVTTGRNQRLG